MASAKKISARFPNTKFGGISNSFASEVELLGILNCGKSNNSLPSQSGKVAKNPCIEVGVDF